MNDLFTQSSAVIDGPADCYRYELRRAWELDLPLLVVCMLNPSTADADKNDPTILALIHFAKLWGYGGLLIVNLCAYRSSSPSDMMTAVNPAGRYNGVYLSHAMEYARDNGGQMLVAWGNDGAFQRRDEMICIKAKEIGVSLVCLGTTLSGAPKHPMARGKHRISREQQPVAWSRP